MQMPSILMMRHVRCARISTFWMTRRSGQHPLSDPSSHRTRIQPANGLQHARGRRYSHTQTTISSTPTMLLSSPLVHADMHERGDKSERTDGPFSRSGFEWDDDNDRYTCPEGKNLAATRRNRSDPRRKEPRKGRRKYRATQALCDACPSKMTCCPGTAPAISPARNAKMRATLHGWPPNPTSPKSPGPNARRSRCSLPT